MDWKSLSYHRRPGGACGLSAWVQGGLLAAKIITFEKRERKRVTERTYGDQVRRVRQVETQASSLPRTGEWGGLVKVCGEVWLRCVGLSETPLLEPRSGISACYGGICCFISDPPF